MVVPATLADTARVVAVTSAIPVLVATDCSGLGSPVLVLQRMGIPYRHLLDHRGLEGPVGLVRGGCRTGIDEHSSWRHGPPSEAAPPGERWQAVCLERLSFDRGGFEGPRLGSGGELTTALSILAG
jgi:hypothetical protein